MGRMDSGAVAAAYAALRRQGDAWLAAQARDAAPSLEKYGADVRYAGQSFDVATSIDAEAAARGNVEAIAQAFHGEHRRLFGHANPGAAVDIISLRLRVRGGLPAPEAVRLAAVTATPVAGVRQVRFNGAWRATPLFAWVDLPVGWAMPGPAIIEQETATVVVPPAFTVAVGDFGDLVLSRD